MTPPKASWAARWCQGGAGRCYPLGMPIKPPRPPAGPAVHTERRFSLRICALPLRDGATEDRGVVIHGGSVVILARLPDDQLVFIRNRRWQIGHRLLELPAGTLGPGEDPAACAARELEEEAGFRAGRVTLLQPFYALPGLTTEIMYAYLAEDLTPVGQRLEPDEDIEVAPLPVAEVRRLMAAGEIHDMKSLAVLGAWFARG